MRMFNAAAASISAIACVTTLMAQTMPAPLSVTSTAFLDGGPMPKAHSAVGTNPNLSPPLSWSGTPASTAQFAVIAQGDATMSRTGRPPVVWVVYGIPGSATGLPTGMKPGNVISGPLSGAIQGVSDFDNLGGSTSGRVADSRTTAEYKNPFDKGNQPFWYDTGAQPKVRLTTPIVIHGSEWSASQPRYHGPAPGLSGRTQTYTFTVYAIDTDLNLPDGLTGEQVRVAIDWHVVGKGELTGFFRR